MNNQCLQNRYELFIRECVKMTVNVNMELDKNVNLGIGQFVSILFSLIDIIKLSLLKIDRS